MKFDYMQPAKTVEEAIKEYPDCGVFIEVEGGWAGFENVSEYELWINQK